MKLFLDTETTGLQPARHAIHSISCILLDGSQEHSFTANLAPFAGAVVDDKALEVSGVTHDQLMSYPKQDEILRQFVKWIVELKPVNLALPVFAYNSDFDLSFVKSWFERNGKRNEFWLLFRCPWPCVRSLAQICLLNDNLHNFKLSTVYEHLFDKQLDAAHTADADCRGMMEVYRYLSLIHNIK